MIEEIEGLYSASSQAMRRSLIRELLKLTRRQGIISFAGGLPDPSTFPVDELVRISAEVLEEQGRLALQYGPTEGDPKLREELGRWMAKDGITAGVDNILVTSGSQQGLDLVGRIFLDPGDPIIVELPTYLGGLTAFRSYRPEIIGVPLDEEGMRTDLLEQTLETLRRQGRRPKFIYIVPDFQNPSGITMSRVRREHLLELAKQYRTLVVEDSPYRELRFEGGAPPPLFALDREGRVIYLSTFSKTIAPGLRIAWVVANEEIISRFVTAKQSMDLCSPALTQAIAAEFCARGYLSARIPRIIELYRHKRDVMLESLETEMPEGVSWTRPEGGLFLWVRLPEGLDTEAMLPEAIEEEGVAYVVGSGFYADGSGKNTMRLTFCYPSPEEIREGIRRLARLVRRYL